MPNPGAIFFKALMALAVAFLVYQYARQVATVKVTVVAEGRMTSTAVEPDDPNYRDEMEGARKKAIPFYVVAGLWALIGLFGVRKGVRVGRERWRDRRAEPLRP